MPEHQEPFGAPPPSGTAQEVLRDALRQYGLTPGAAPFIENQLAARGYVIVSAGRAAALLDALREAEIWISEDRDNLVASCTIADADGRPDESTLDATEGDALAEVDALLACIRSAIAEPPFPPTKKDDAP